MNLDFELFPATADDDNPRANRKIFPLLEGIRDTGTVKQAALKSEISPRHAWKIIRSWEEFLGQSLCTGDRGVGYGTYLTPFGLRFLQAEERFRAAVTPTLASAVSQFASSLQEALRESSDDYGRGGSLPDKNSAKE